MSQETRRRFIARGLLANRAETAEAAAGGLEVPSYARGLEHVPDPEKLHVGRFSTGHEALPEHTPAKDHVGRFDQGQDVAPEPPNPLHVGRFSEGIDARQPVREPAA